MFKPRNETYTVANGDTLSPEIDMQGTTLLAVFVPTITSGTVRFQGSNVSGGTYSDVDDTTPAALAIAASTGGFWIDATFLAKFQGIPFLKIKCGASQGADRAFIVVRGRESGAGRG